MIGKDESLAEVIGRCAEQLPQHPALFTGERLYTYAELWTLVKQVYAKIPAAPALSRIGIYCNEDVYTYAAIIAVNLYGAAYIPLNRQFPVQRNRRIATETGMELLLATADDPALHGIAPGFPVLILDDSMKTDAAAIDAIRINKKNTVWYILFTSGSTAQPKGVPVTGDNVRAFFNYYLRNYDFNAADRFLQVYELNFDVSVFSFFMPLLVGACCYVVPDSGIRFIKIIEQLQQHAITVVSMVPTVLSYLESFLPEIRLPSLRYSFFSGDALYHRLALQWRNAVPNAAIHNFYGPTETTIVCTRYIFDEAASGQESVNGIVPLGKAFEGMEFLLVDEELQPAVKGELCFTGTQVVPGYLNGAYEEKFFTYNNRRYYRTGDIAAVDTSGNLVFYGRTDEQVKIGGYRVELQEVEAAVSASAGCRCKVLAVKDAAGRTQLAAFIETAQLDKKKLAEAVLEQLPAYMLPQHFIAVERFPANANGKIDRAQLLDLQE